jgi:hypothetical protein
MADPAPLKPTPAPWRQDPVTPPPSGERSPRNRRAIFIVVAFLLVLGGAFLGLLTWAAPVPHPTLVPLFVSDYESPPLAAPAFADPDRRALGGGDYFLAAKGTDTGKRQRHQLVRDLAALRQRQDSTAVVVYLSAYALCDDKGAVQILPADGRPDEPKTWVPLRQVLEALKECPAQNKLLILDVMRPLADSYLGVLRDDVAAAVKEELDEVDDPRRLVLCACEPGQVSLGSEELGRSVFGYYLEQGLRGWADGYRGDGFRDGTVSVHELAEFVRARVDRWAVQNRQTRQTPVLYGSGHNFRLVAMDHGLPQEPLGTAAEAKYPAWLLEAWKKYDQGVKDRSYRLTPRLARQQQALLLQAERDWRYGRPAPLLQTRRRAELDRVQGELVKWQQLTRPPAPSLALAAVAGEKVDDELKKAFEELQILLKAPPIKEAGGHEKLIDDFRTKWKGKPAYALARLVFSAALEETNPTPEKLRPLDALLVRPKEEQPRYVETLVLRRLVEMAGPPPVPEKGKAPPPSKGPPWPSEAVRLLLDVTAKGEQAASQAETFAWNADLLDRAAQLRHEGEVLFWARGYAAPAEAEERLRQAADEYRTILTRADLVQKAQEVLDDATLTLPAYVPYLEAVPERTAAWTEAVRATRKLRDLLHPAEQGSARKVEELQEKTDLLRRQLAALREPFSPDNAGALARRAKQPEADAGALADVNALLATPFVRAEDRAALWQAGRELQRRLNKQTREQDTDDDEWKQRTAAQSDFNGEEAAAREDERGERRAAVALELLGLMLEREGHADEKLREAEAALQDIRSGKRDHAHWHALGAALRRAWTRQLHERLEADATPAGQDWLSRLAPPLDDVPGLDRPGAPPTVKLRTQQIAVLSDWLADRFRYQARDYRLGKLDQALPTSLERFLDQAAQNLRPVAAAQAYAQLAHGPLGVNRLSESNSPIRVPVRVELIGAQGPQPETLPLEVFNADRQWLKSKLLGGASRAPAADGGAWAFTGSLELTVPPGAEALARQPPQGVVVQARFGQRTYHYKLDVPLTGRAQPLELLIGAAPNPKSAVAADGVTLRPGKFRQAYFLFLRNRGQEPRKVTVELKAGGEVPKGGAVTVIVEPGQTEPVPLGEGAALPKDDLPPLAGPLEVRLLDGDTKALLVTRPLAVDVALPRNYVRVTEIEFRPAGATKAKKNRLQVTLRSLLPTAGPPILAELVLPPDRIPGLIAAKDGTFKGTMPAKAGPDEEPLQLYAENIDLREVPDEDGIAYLNVDGYERAFIFHTTFARRGPTTTPRGDIKPAVRLRADRYLPASDKVPILMEVDNPPDGATLEFAVGRRYAGEFKPDLPPLRFADAKQRQLGFSLDGSKNALVFTAAIKDWLVALDTTKLLGQRELRARLLSATGKELEVVYQPVTVSNSAPDVVRIVEAPKKAQRGSTMTFKALAQDRDGAVSKVFFFVGQPQEGKVPKEAKLIPAEPVDARRAVWAAQVPLPEDRKGPTDVSVQVVNAVGLSTFETVSVELTETDPAKTGPGKISGKVLLGSLPQPGLVVLLSDAKGLEKQRTKTRPDGTYLFEGVAPGTYRVTAYKQEAQRRGTAVAEVLPNKETSVDVALMLR